MDFSKDGIVQYKDSISGYILQLVKNKNNEVSMWLEETSSSTKVVKSRPMWMYPELFDLPEEEKIIKSISKKWNDKRTEEIVNFTHNQLPYFLCREDETIPYELYNGRVCQDT